MSSYTPASGHIYSPHPQPSLGYRSSPPPPPPKPSTSSTPARGPPLPPPPTVQAQNEPLELDAESGQGHYHQHQQYLAPQSTIPPVEAGWLPDLVQEQTTSDLHDLLRDPSLQSALLSNPGTTHPSLPASEAVLQPLIDANIQLATQLQHLEARLSRQRQTTQSRLLALRALEQQHRSKIAETEEALKQFSPMALYQRLNASVQEQEMLIRGLQESWLEEGGVASEREVAELVRQVKEAQKVAFLRQERRERWDEGRVGGWR